MFKTVATAGFSLFSMFFGSGNIIFPIDLGRQALSSYPYSILGFVLTAVLVPVLGFLGMIFSNGDHRLYFNKLGRYPSFALTAMMLCLIGPFGVVPRCISVSFGGVQVLYPTMQIWQFSLVFCLFLAVLVWRPNKVISIIGNILTPFKLGSILFLIVIGLWFAPSENIIASTPILPNIVNGITQGYQTMDLLAAFFFAVSIVAFIRQREPNPYKLFKASLYAGALGAFLLIAVYTGFVILGATYSDQIQGFARESLLARISGIVLGDFAVYIVSFTIAISCLATATILVKLFVEFLQNDVLKNRLGYHTCLFITLIISFIGSLFGFEVIVAWIFWFLSWMYPLLIVYAIYKVYEGLVQKNELVYS